MKQIFNTKLIDDYLKGYNMSKTAFCRKCKIATSTLYKICAQNDNINILSIYKIASAMKISMSNLFIS